MKLSSLSGGLGTVRLYAHPCAFERTGGKAAFRGENRLVFAAFAGRTVKGRIAPLLKQAAGRQCAILRKTDSANAPKSAFLKTKQRIKNAGFSSGIDAGSWISQENRVIDFSVIWLSRQPD